MRRPSSLTVFLTHAGLVVVTLITLYPVLWVIKMAVEPSQSFSMGLSPIPDEELKLEKN